MRVCTPEENARAYAYLRSKQPRGLIVFHAEGELLYHEAMAQGLPRDGVPTVAVKGYRSHRAMGRMWGACARALRSKRGPRSRRLTRHRAALVCIREHRIQRRKAWRVTMPIWPAGSEKQRRKVEREWARRQAKASGFWRETFEMIEQDLNDCLPVPHVAPISPLAELIDAKLDAMAKTMERVL